MPITVKATGNISDTTVTSVTLGPPGTVTPGDLIVVATYGASPTMTDTRMTQVSVSPDGAARMWHGIDNGGGDTLALAVTASAYNAIVWAVIADRNNLPEVAGTTSGNVAAPVPSTTSNKVIAVAAGGHSTGGGNPTLLSPWTPLAQAPGRAAASIFLWEGDPPSPSTTWANGTSAVPERHATATLALTVYTVAPPCRLFPRDDGLGVGSGRHYPPPKSQQRSGRRFGYY